MLILHGFELITIRQPVRSSNIQKGEQFEKGAAAIDIVTALFKRLRMPGTEQ